MNSECKIKIKLKCLQCMKEHQRCKQKQKIMKTSSNNVGNKFEWHLNVFAAYVYQEGEILVFRRRSTVTRRSEVNECDDKLKETNLEKNRESRLEKLNKKKKLLCPRSW